MGTLAAILVILVFLFVVFSEALDYEEREDPEPYWVRFRKQLEEDRKWWECQESPEGCLWPDSCRPGDCRRVPDEVD